ncbi:hypothetical protein GALMADRAFT_675582 [Galerina marginata CBS 339.88]|uniref:Uncharacterized protein n=1 Tax=Galerina marginata (strain CBS 339.88) TaxID=685588 RepID=A0A067TV61_GALM3|nr:hypothetical protein GALMADRAFT_675582 [Galerina marginata CBS 339.88]
MSPQFAFLRNLRSNETPASSVQPFDIKDRGGNKSTRKLRKPSTGSNPHAPNPASGLHELNVFHKKFQLTDTVQPNPGQPRSDSVPRSAFPPPYPVDYVEKDYGRESTIPNETPIVSRYFPNSYRDSQEAPPVPAALAGSWSPIPSVHRESFKDDEFYEEEFENQGQESWVDNSNHYSPEINGHPAGRVAHPRPSKQASIEKEDEGHDPHYVEYPILKSKQEIWVGQENKLSAKD